MITFDSKIPIISQNERLDKVVLFLFPDIGPNLFQ
jgi:hypothetical protein